MKEMEFSGLIEKEGGYIWYMMGLGKMVIFFKVV